MRQPILPKVRFRVLARSGFHCVYCGDSGPLVIDHVLPVKLGGTNNETNLVASCQLCNAGKAATNIVAIRKTFPGWLLAQRGREDPVGDLADDERYDISTEPDSYKELSEFLRKRSACYPVLRAAWHAWREWKRGGLMTRATREAHAEMRADLRKNATDDGSCYWTKSGFWVNGKFFPYKQ